MSAPGMILRRAVPFAIAIGTWFTPGPAGLTPHAWHLLAVFVAAIACVLIGAFRLLTASMIAVATVVLCETITPAQAFSGFANTSVLLVVISFVVAQAVVKSGLGQRISLFMVRLRRLTPGSCLQHRADRRRHCTGLPQQHGAQWRALPDRVVGGPGGGLQSRRPGGAAAGRLSDVLRDGEPRGVPVNRDTLGVLGHGVTTAATRATGGEWPCSPCRKQELYCTSIPRNRPFADFADCRRYSPRCRI